MKINALDFAALQALYNSTGGDNWNTSTSWDFSSETLPDTTFVSRWYGVKVSRA
ncbi:MAG: hypothetical protein EBE86_015065 [Hormoscilla sp. GUM202]|nr:hypothetical protein [Hormoscilla sp. GUM202]